MTEISTFETEKAVHEAKMSYGDMESMMQSIKELGEQLVTLDLAYQALAEATEELVSADKMQQIDTLSEQKITEYLDRFLSDEMKQELADAGVPGMHAVPVTGYFGDEAIEEGYDVYAVKDGNSYILKHAGDASKAETEGYTIVVKPFVYESEIKRDAQRF